MTRWAGLVLGGLVVTGALEGGCTLQSNDSSRYRDGIPQGAEVAVAVPRAAGSGTTGQAHATLRIENNGPSGLTPNGPTVGAGYAQFYELTRNISDGVDLGTAAVLGIVWLIVNQPPTSETAHQAVWGPWQGDGLSPVVWRFTASEVGDHEYDYELDGRPKASTSEADWRAVLQGHGFGKERPEHRSGWFLFDNDAEAALDPLRANGTGTVKVTYDLRTFPVTIAVAIKTNDGTGAWADVGVTHQADGSGEVDIQGLFDVETLKDGNLETVDLKSRWEHDGAGRSDVKITGGDVPPQDGTVLASECWSSDFTRSYYTDNIGYQPTVGDPSSCVFPQAQF